MALNVTIDMMVISLCICVGESTTLQRFVVRRCATPGHTSVQKYKRRRTPPNHLRRIIEYFCLLTEIYGIKKRSYGRKSHEDNTQQPTAGRTTICGDQPVRDAPDQAWRKSDPRTDQPRADPLSPDARTAVSAFLYCLSCGVACAACGLPRQLP